MRYEYKTENTNIGKIVCFGTSAMMKSMKKPVSKVADTVGVVVANEEFHCRGSFGPMHKGRPNANDLEEISGYVTAFLVVLVVEILIGIFVQDNFVRPYVGEMLVTVLLCYLCRATIPDCPSDAGIPICSSS